MVVLQKKKKKMRNYYFSSYIWIVIILSLLFRGNYTPLYPKFDGEKNSKFLIKSYPYVYISNKIF